jgi:hypothetical protein
VVFPIFHTAEKQYQDLVLGGRPSGQMSWNYLSARREHLPVLRRPWIICSANVNGKDAAQNNSDRGAT